MKRSARQFHPASLFDILQARRASDGWMDEWLAGRFDYDEKAMGRHGRELWWLGWTAVILGAIPLIAIWSIVQLPRDSVLSALASSVPPWAPAAAIAIAVVYLGLMLAWLGWYIRRLGTRVHSQI